MTAFTFQFNCTSPTSNDVWSVPGGLPPVSTGLSSVRGTAPEGNASHSRSRSKSLTVENPPRHREGSPPIVSTGLGRGTDTVLSPLTTQLGSFQTLTVDDLFQCFICMSLLEDPVICPKCTKLCCRPCMTRWITDHKSECPHCRAPLQISQLINCRFVTELHEKLTDLSLDNPTDVPSPGTTPMSSADHCCAAHQRDWVYYCVDCLVPLCTDCIGDPVDHVDHALDQLDTVYEQGLGRVHETSDKLMATQRVVEDHLTQVNTHWVNLVQSKQESEALLESFLNTEREKLNRAFSAKEAGILEQRKTLAALRHQMQHVRSSLSLLLTHHSKPQLVIYHDILEDKVTSILNGVRDVRGSDLPSLEWPLSCVPNYEYDSVRIPHFRQVDHSLPSETFTFQGPVFLAAGIIWRLQVTRDNDYVNIQVEMVNGRPIDQPAIYRGIIQLVHPDSASKASQERIFSGSYAQSVQHGVVRMCSLATLEEQGYYHSPDDSIVIRYGLRADSFTTKDQDQSQYINRLEQSLLQLKQQGFTPAATNFMEHSSGSEVDSLHDRVSLNTSAKETTSFDFQLPYPTINQVLGSAPLATTSTNPSDDPFVFSTTYQAAQTGDDPDWSFLDNSPHNPFPDDTPLFDQTKPVVPECLSDTETDIRSPTPPLSNLSSPFPNLRFNSLSRRATTGLIDPGSSEFYGHGLALGTDVTPSASPRHSIGGSLVPSERAAPPGLRRLTDVFQRTTLPNENSQDFQSWLEERRRSGGRGTFSSATFRPLHEAYDRKNSTTLASPTVYQRRPSKAEVASPSNRGGLGIPLNRKLTSRKSSPFPLNVSIALEMAEAQSASKPPTKHSPVTPTHSPKSNRLAAPNIGPRMSPLRRSFSRSATRKHVRPTLGSLGKGAGGKAFYTPILMRSLRRPGELEELIRRQKEDPKFAAQILQDHKAFFQKRIRRPLEGDPSDGEQKPSILSSDDGDQTLGPNITLHYPETSESPRQLTSPVNTHYTSEIGISRRPSQQSNATTSQKRASLGVSLRSPMSARKGKPRTRAISLGRRQTSISSGSSRVTGSNTVSKTLAATISPRNSRRKSVSLRKPPIPPTLGGLLRNRGHSGTQPAGDPLQSSITQPTRATAVPVSPVNKPASRLGRYLSHAKPVSLRMQTTESKIRSPLSPSKNKPAPVKSSLPATRKSTLQSGLK
ncbi:Tripartite motif containing 37 [Dispira parvispora]|uniref:Tripartite motif containing 37 n=1 Tax=Dispira parvispora TaxID=1520584 RepID=A0A9W8AQ11_9FUNG|nr:Tripartite motif containing 37 [Dispira parvispora]